MANTIAAKKAWRTSLRRRKVNRMRRSSTRTAIKHAEVALESGQLDNIMTLLRNAEASLARSAQRGIVKKNSAARKISRLTVRARKLAEQAVAVEQTIAT